MINLINEKYIKIRMKFEFKVEMKLCPKCYLPAYAATLTETGRTHYYCQNGFCVNMGKSIE
jgi:hypothetical protein